MKVVVLDGYTLNPGDLCWTALNELGECMVCEGTPPELTIERCTGASIVLTNKVVLDAAVLAELPDLKYIGVLATGYNVVDLEAARAQGVIVTNVPAYSTDSVAQLVFAHILNLTHRVADHSSTARAGKWSECPDFCYWDYPLTELSGKTLGVVGLGRIGGAVARIGQAFGMEVIAYAPGKDPAAFPYQLVALDDLFARSDIVTLHCPLKPETEHLVNRERLALMKPTAFLINTGRGPLIDDAAVAEALNEGRLAGAGLDVLTHEPPRPDNPLLSAQNCFITPHFGWATREARQRLMDQAVANVAAFLNGRPINVVS